MALAAAVQEKAGTVVPALMPFIRPEKAGLTPIAPPRHIVGAPRFLQVGAGRKVAGQNASAVRCQLRFAQLLIRQLHHGQRCSTCGPQTPAYGVGDSIREPAYGAIALSILN